jgi:hypothetical protein
MNKEKKTYTDEQMRIIIKINIDPNIRLQILKSLSPIKLNIVHWDILQNINNID